ncbi:hypothetical protein [Polaromonas aquatica]|uniref:hypothetical protein n=1 Tax=Polaromonas aquatica TaxID=332657 RepID=UPI003D65A3BD
MRPAFAIAVLAIAASGGAHATGSLSFESAGYVLDFEVGQQERPVLAGVSFAALEAGSNPMLRPPHLVVMAFDTKAKLLLVRYKNPGDSKLPPDFELSVRGSEGVLKLSNRAVTGRFNWEM